MNRNVALLLVAVLLSGCTSTGTFGVLTKSTGSPGTLLDSERPYEELGSVEGEACRYFLLGIIPWGDSTPTAAIDIALAESGGDAIINGSVSTSLYGFIPIWNVFSMTCTTVKGIAIKFQ